MIEIRISDKEMLPVRQEGELFRLFKKRLAEKGYEKLDGAGMKEYDRLSLEVVYTYELGRRDILFKRFDGWTPTWQKTKQILFRRF